MIKTKGKVNKNLFLMFILSIFLLASLTGCGAKGKKSPSIKDIEGKIKKEVNVSEMDKGDKEKLERFYGIKAEDVEEFMLYAPKSNLKASEIAIIKVKDSKKVDEIKGKVEKRLEKQTNSFKDYLPKEYALIEKKVLKTNDNYILFAISKDVEKIEKIFDESFK